MLRNNWLYLLSSVQFICCERGFIIQKALLNSAHFSYLFFIRLNQMNYSLSCIWSLKMQLLSYYKTVGLFKTLKADRF